MIYRSTDSIWIYWRWNIEAQILFEFSEVEVSEQGFYLNLFKMKYWSTGFILIYSRWNVKARIRFKFIKDEIWNYGLDSNFLYVQCESMDFI